MNAPESSPHTAAAADPFAGLHLEHTSTVERVAEELRRAIFDGELESGTPLREVALAASLQVSRPTVREALGALGGPGGTRGPPCLWGWSGGRRPGPVGGGGGGA